MKKIVIGVFVGSARKKAYSGSIANALVGMMPAHFEMRPMPMDNLPLFNQDYDDEGKTPPEWTAFRKAVAALDGYLFVTPEYNRGLPPLLKNAVDIASRPAGKSVWGGKPGAVVSVSPGSQGGFGANHQLRQTLTLLNIYTMQQPEAYINNVTASLDENGALNSERTKGFLQNIADAFAKWVEVFIK